MKTFSVQILGCKVNQYEGEQIAELLRTRGLVQAETPERADLRVIHTCSVTVQAASKSRQTVRRAVRLPLLAENEHTPGATGINLDKNLETSAGSGGLERARVVVTGCWATSDRPAAEALPGVDAVLSHGNDIAAELDQLLTQWTKRTTKTTVRPEPPLMPSADDGWIDESRAKAGQLTTDIEASPHALVKRNSAGTTRLPMLGAHQVGRQRAFLKVQDGCDAHCTYCIIPSLRPVIWSKSVDDAVTEARALVDSGHVEIVLTGIFLGAYGQVTALRRRQIIGSGDSLGHLISALCTRVPGMKRLRLSSLEPGDLTPSLLSTLRSHEQVVPHFHLPLQSGSPRLLRRMNRQYTRDDYLRMLDDIHRSFDRPALTTDVIVGFPGETDEEFQKTADVVERAAFIHVHAFSYSPRPQTAAARWRKVFVQGQVVNERIERLANMGRVNSYAFRQRFLGETVRLLVETASEDDCTRHGRSERYFDVTVSARGIETGQFIRARITHVTPEQTLGEVLA